MSLDKHRRYTNLTTHVISQDNLSSVQVGNCIIFLVHSSKMMFFFFTDICCWIMELIKPSLILDAATLKLNLPKAGAGLMELLWNWHNDEKVFETRNIKISLSGGRGDFNRRGHVDGAGVVGTLRAGHRGQPGGDCLAWDWCRSDFYH